MFFFIIKVLTDTFAVDQRLEVEGWCKLAGWGSTEDSSATQKTLQCSLETTIGGPHHTAGKESVHYAGNPDMEVEGKFLKIGFPKCANFDGGLL